MFEKFSIRTGKRTEFIDITHQIENYILEQNIEEGLCVVFVPHTTAGVTINENADPTVVEDIIMELEKIVPFDDNYKHFEGNSAAHIKSSLMGTSTNIIIENGKLKLGTWQGIYFTEFDGPRNRDFYVKIIQKG